MLLLVLDKCPARSRPRLAGASEIVLEPAALQPASAQKHHSPNLGYPNTLLKHYYDYNSYVLALPKKQGTTVIKEKCRSQQWDDRSVGSYGSRIRRRLTVPGSLRRTGLPSSAINISFIIKLEQSHQSSKSGIRKL